MGIAAERIDSILAFANQRFAAGDTLKTVVHAVKDANPGLTVTGTFASVMAEDPYREEGRFSLFLVNGSNHCWEITANPAGATGIVIAERDDDE
ncbi:MAG TPA: hypothetical protein VGE20_09650 [Ramlibacter sp.]